VRADPRLEVRRHVARVVLPKVLGGTLAIPDAALSATAPVAPPLESARSRNCSAISSSRPDAFSRPRSSALLTPAATPCAASRTRSTAPDEDSLGSSACAAARPQSLVLERDGSSSLDAVRALNPPFGSPSRSSQRTLRV
jgi:hypothetical protein